MTTFKNVWNMMHFDTRQLHSSVERDVSRFGRLHISGIRFKWFEFAIVNYLWVMHNIGKKKRQNCNTVKIVNRKECHWLFLGINLPTYLVPEISTFKEA